MIIENTFQLVANTPLLRIRGFGIPDQVELYAKLEMMNPCGGIKDRIGLYILDDYVSKGILTPSMTIVEASAGNTALAVAFAAIKYGIKTIFVIPDKFAMEKRVLLEALGAKVMVTPGNLGMSHAIGVADKIRASMENAISIKQFENPLNAEAHREITAKEIKEDLNRLDYFVCGGGSCGTFMGISSGLKEKFEHLKSILVDPLGSVLGYGDPHPFHIEGLGNFFVPAILDRDHIDEVFKISDEQAKMMTRQIAKELGLFVGVSSGANLFASVEVAKKIKEGVIVTVFFDRGERYLSQSIYQ